MAASLSDILPVNPTPAQIAQAQEIVGALMGGQQQPEPVIGAAEKRAARRQQESQFAQLFARRTGEELPESRAELAGRGSSLPAPDQKIPGSPELPPEAKNMVAALQGGASKAAAAPTHIPQFGLEAGQIPIGLPPRIAVGMMGAGHSNADINRLQSILSPQFQSDPVTGKQFAIMPNGRVIPVGQGIPTMGTFKAGEGLELPYTWERHPGGISPRLQIPTGEDDGGVSGGIGPRAQNNPRNGGQQTPGDFPASGLGSSIDRLKSGLSSQKAAEKERLTIGEKAGEGRVATWNDAVKAAGNTYAVLQDLSTMRDAYANSGVQGGPLQKYLQGARSVVAQLFPDSNLSDLTAPADVIDKVNFGMATKIARELTARPTQMEVAAAMRNNPGLQMNNKGSLYMIDLMTQIQLQKQELGQIAASMPSDKVWQWPAIEQQYYASHPLTSPISKQPLTGTGAIVKDIESIGGLKTAGGTDLDRMPAPLIYDPVTKEFRPLKSIQ